MKTNRWGLYLLVAVIFLVGCASNENGDKVKVKKDEVKVESKDGTKATIKTDKEGTVKIQGEDAEGNETNVEITSDAKKIPADFPKEIPIPKQGEITSSSSIKTDDGQVLQVVYEIDEKDMNANSLVELYKNFLTENNYTIELEMTIEEMVQITATKTENTFFQIVISQEEGKPIQVMLMYTVSTK